MLNCSFLPQQSRCSDRSAGRFISHVRVLGFSGCLLAGMWMGSESTNAAITVTGDVTPTYDGTSDPWTTEIDVYLNAWSHLRVGRTDAGTMRIDNGSRVNSGGGTIGGGDQVSTVTISGSYSTWNTCTTYDMGLPDQDSTFSVGKYGPAELVIENGARLYSHSSDVSSGSTVTVSGYGSRWDVYSTGFNIHTLGLSGELLIEDGGVVETDGLYTSASAKITISGAGSRLCAGEGYYPVSKGGGGIIDISDGGYLEEMWSAFSLGSGLTKQLTVTGDGSEWYAYTLSVAGTGSGSVTIKDGGFADVNSGSIGSTTSSDCTLDLQFEGAGSKMLISNQLGIGGQGRGTLNMSGDEENNGLLEVTRDLVLGSASTGDGTFNLAGGTLDMNNRDIEVGSGTGTFNFTGGVLLNVAAIDLKQDFTQDGGTLAPGGPIGQTSIVGGYNLNAGTVEINLYGLLGNRSDLLTVSGDINIATVGTTLDLSALGPIYAGTYTVIESTGGTLTGEFEQITGMGYYPGLVSVGYTANAVTITLAEFYQPGDLNGDGFVGLDDLDIVLSNWNTSVPPGDAAADPSGDGFVGLDDLDIVLTYWNTGTVPPLQQIDIVPEPGTVLLLGAGLAACCRTRQRMA